MGDLSGRRILHLINHCRHGHGNAHAAIDLACAQVKSGQVVYYASEGGEFSHLLCHHGVSLRHIPQRTKNPILFILSAIRVIFLIRKERIDTIHSHMMSGVIIGFIASIFTKAQLVATVHNSFDRHSALMKLAHKIVAVSHNDAELLVANGFSRRRLFVVLNGPLNSARYELDEDPPVYELPRPSITTVCGLHDRKGVKYLLEAFRLVNHQKKCFLNIVGDGPDRQQLEALAERTGYGGRIKFHGSIKNPMPLLRGSDIFVLASLAEPLGLVNLEARASHCAIVATNVGGIPEALDYGEAGILVPPKDPKSMAKEIVRLLSDQRRLSEWKVKASSNTDKFDVEEFSRAYSRIYDLPKTSRFI